MPGPISSIPSHDQLLSLDEAVDCGHIGYSTPRKNTADGRLPAHRVGRIRPRRSDLQHRLLDPGPDAVASAIDRLVASAPPLTAEQTRRLRDLLGGAL